MSYQYQSVTTETPEPPKKKSTVWVIIGVIALIVIICFCIAASAALLYFDPFDWGILGRLTGGYDSIARTVPADTDMHFSIDMLKLLSDDTQDVFNAFAKSSGDPSVQSREDVIKEMDASLLEEFGVTFSDDIQPWIGQYAGVSFFDVNMNQGSETFKWVFAIETRDKKAADAFIEKLVAHYAEKMGMRFQEIEYENTILFEMADDYNPFAIGRYKGLVFLSSDADFIIRAIDAPKGETLAKNDDYRSITKELPSSRIMTVFMNKTYFDNVYNLSGGDIPSLGLNPDIFQSSGISLSLVGNSIQMDVISAYDPDLLTEEQLALLTSQGASEKIAEDFPQDSILLLAGHDLSQIYTSSIQIIASTSGMSTQEISESMQLLEDQIGINPERDLFPYLDQDWGMALVKEHDTLLAEELDFPVGIIAYFGTSDKQQLGQNLSNTADHLSGMGLMSIDEKSIDGMTLYEASIYMMGEPLFTFGMKDNQMLLGTSSSRFENAPNRNQSLAESEGWKKAWKNVPNGMSPALYLDFQELINMIPDVNMTDMQYFKPIDKILLADSPLKGSTKHTLLVITIKTE